MIGFLDAQVIEKFKEFQKKTGKYSDLDIDEVRFEKIALSNKKYFQFVKGKNKYIQEYISKHLGEFPILGSSLKNDCIANYIVPIDTSDIVNQTCVSFNKDNAKGSQPFYRDYPFLMDRHHIAILSSDKISPKYLYNSLRYYFDKSKFGWGENVASVEEVEKHSMPIPQGINEKYTSYIVQEALVEFLRYSFENIDKIRANIDKHFDIVNRMKKSLIPSTFKRTVIQNRFKKYAIANGINFDITDINYEIKKIHSKNKSEIVCDKRMGFSPRKDKNDDINWFRVEDLNANMGLFIDKPNTVLKTTMKKVYEKNGKNSSKNIPIRRGDILVSFLATPGVVKIYNSDEVAYCNQAIDILTVDQNYNNKYIAYNCMLEYPKYGRDQTMGRNLNDDDKAKIKILIPKPFNTYTSFQIQTILSDFIEHTENDLQENHLNKIYRAYEVIDKLQKTYLARTFSLIDWRTK